MAHDVGKDVLSYCGKCKLKLSHLIVAMNDKKIVKVQCNTCKGIHAFKDPAMTFKKKSASSSTKSKKTAAVPVSVLWEEAMQSNKQKQTIPYTIKGKFEIGDIVDHKTFGNGIVNSIVDNNKIEVIFQADIKTLVHNI